MQNDAQTQRWVSIDAMIRKIKEGGKKSVAPGSLQGQHLLRLLLTESNSVWGFSSNRNIRENMLKPVIPALILSFVASSKLPLLK